MGAWIETYLGYSHRILHKKSHPTMGAWIEIAVCRIVIKIVCSRTPRWVRGLKLACVKYNALLGLSHPTMGAWIEIEP